MGTGNSSGLSDGDIAAACNARVWELLPRTGRTPAESDEMLYAAYASAYHWQRAGTGLHRQRAEWLIARAHAELGNADAALRHALRCRELTDEFAPLMQDFDVAYCWEALARAHAVAGRDDEARGYRQEARHAGNGIANSEDRAIFQEDLKGGDWHNLT